MLERQDTERKKAPPKNTGDVQEAALEKYHSAPIRKLPKAKERITIRQYNAPSQ